MILTKNEVEIILILRRACPVVPFAWYNPDSQS